MPPVSTNPVCDLFNMLPIKLINYQTIEDVDRKTGSRNTRIVCYIESRHAWSDSGDAVCFSRPAALEEAARNFLALLAEANNSDRRIGNLATRSTSPGFKRLPSLSDIETPDKLQRAKSTEPDPSASPTRPRRSNSVVASFKTALGRLKSPRK